MVSPIQSKAAFNRATPYENGFHTGILSIIRLAQFNMKWLINGYKLTMYGVYEVEVYEMNMRTRTFIQTIHG